MSLTIVLLSLVFLISQILLTVESVRVNSDLAISGKDFAIVGKHEGVDLYHVAIFCNEAIVDSLEKIFNLV